MSIITTLADTDLYKLTMGHDVNQHHSEATITCSLRIRKKVILAPSDVINIQHEINSMGDKTYSDAELAFIREKCKYFPNHFLTFLKGFRVNPSHVNVSLEDNDLKINAAGIWGDEIYWETPLLGIVSECYFENRAPLSPLQIEEAYEKAKFKAKNFRDMGIYFIDMGTRRRRSYACHDAVIRGLIDGGGEFFLGTSNIHFAAKYNLTPHGTMAHEMFSAVAAMYGVENANAIVLGKWADTYHGNLGIALPDTFTSDFFLKSFDTFSAKLFDGVRHDSGDPNDWFDKFYNHYIKLGINPKFKKAVFSDGIDSFDRIKSIKDHVDNRMLVTFGIGTWLTNDFDDLPALNMVFKLVEAQKNIYQPRRYAVKISDVPGKHNGDEATVQDYLKRISASI